MFLIIYNWKTNKSIITSSWTTPKIYTSFVQIAVRFSTPCIYYNCLRSLGTHSVNRLSQAECSQVICRSYLSRCKGYRVWSLSERAGEWQQARKSWFPTQSGRLALLKAALQTRNVLNWFTYHPYVNAVYPLLKVWFSIYTHSPGGVCAEFTQVSTLSRTLFSCKTRGRLFGR